MAVKKVDNVADNKVNNVVGLSQNWLHLLKSGVGADVTFRVEGAEEEEDEGDDQHTAVDGAVAKPNNEKSPKSSNDGVLHAHKLVLTTRSTYFGTLFGTGKTF